MTPPSRVPLHIIIGPGRHIGGHFHDVLTDAVDLGGVGDAGHGAELDVVITVRHGEDKHIFEWEQARFSTVDIPEDVLDALRKVAQALLDLIVVDHSRTPP